jgi:WD40 repeat protein
MKHEGSVRGAQFSPDGSRILSWSENTLRLWDAAWHGGNLFEIACNDTPQNHDLARLSERYGVRIADMICQTPQKIPVPDWSKVELAPQ